MVEKDLSRLDFLADAIVSAPGMMRDFTNNVTLREPSPELRRAVEAIRKVFEAEPGGEPKGPIGLDRLRAIASRLLADPDNSVKIAGYALARAIENVTPRVNARRAAGT